MCTDKKQIFTSFYIKKKCFSGIGNGMLNIIAFAVANDYFDKRAATACSIILGCSGVGGFYAPFLNNWLVGMYSHTGAMLINGGLMLHSIVCAFIYRPLPLIIPNVPSDMPTSVSTSQLLEYQENGSMTSAILDNRSITGSIQSSSVRSTAGSTVELITIKKPNRFAWEICKNTRFWVYSFCVMLLDVGFFNVTTYLPLKSLELQGKDVNEAVSVSIFSAADAIARLLCSAVWDTGIFSSVYARQLGHSFATGVIGIAMALTCLMDNYVVFLMWSTFFGLFVGIALSPTMAIMKDIARPERFADALSINFILEGPVTFLSPLILGKLYTYGYYFNRLGSVISQNKLANYVE